MFRRKEDSDSLFDNTNDDMGHAGPGESAAVIPPAQSSAASASSSPFSSPSSVHGSGSSSVSTGSRPVSETRPVTASSTFRPNASPMGSDLTRNRMPEPKSSITTAALAVNTVPSTAAVLPTPDKSNKSGSRRILTVGNDILLKGEIATCDRLVIEGKVDATLNDVHTVEIAENGSFKGAAQIEDAEISGLFEGDLVVRNRLVIYATGKVRGKITYGEIEIERGGELTGEIKTISQQTATGGRPSRASSSIKESKFEAA